MLALSNVGTESSQCFALGGVVMLARQYYDNIDINNDNNNNNNNNINNNIAIIIIIIILIIILQ